MKNFAAFARAQIAPSRRRVETTAREAPKKKRKKQRKASPHEVFDVSNEGEDSASAGGSERKKGRAPRVVKFGGSLRISLVSSGTRGRAASFVASLSLTSTTRLRRCHCPVSSTRWIRRTGSGALATKKGKIVGRRAPLFLFVPSRSSARSHPCLFRIARPAARRHWLAHLARFARGRGDEEPLRADRGGGIRYHGRRGAGATTTTTTTTARARR